MSAPSERTRIHAELRDETAQYFLRLVLVLVGAVLAMGLWRAYGSGTLRLQLAMSTLYLVLVASYLARRRIPPWIQLAACIATGSVGGIAIFFVFALFANGAAYLLCACATGALLFGRTAGWSLVGACSLAMLGPFALWCFGTPESSFDARAFFSAPRSWATAVTTLAGFGALLILVAGRITRQLLASERDEISAGARLAAELAELEQAGDALRAEERRYAAAFSGSPDAMAIWDLDSGRIEEANPALLALAGLSREAALQLPASALWARVGLPDSFARALENVPVAGFPTSCIDVTGRPRDLRCNASAFSSVGTRVAMLVLRDVSAQRDRERSLARLTTELETAVAERTAALGEATRELESFAYSVAHHLRAPLRAMNAYAGIALAERTDVLDAVARPLVERIRDTALAMGNQVDALLELSRINRRELHPETVDLSALATEIVAELRAAHPGAGTQVRIEAGLSARADPALARLVLANLLANAWKFSARAGQPLVEFGALDGPEGTAWFVRDNGVGFDMAYASRLFEPFERLHAASEYSGAGIGLATVARAVQRHGGRAWAVSSPGHGATFWFTLA